jgi:hypothetical protein
MSGTRSLRLLLLASVFCAGLALAVSTAGISALATRTQQKLNSPTVLWHAYPLRQAHSSTTQPASNNKPISTRTSKVSTTPPTRTRTNRTDTRPTVVHGNGTASEPTSGTGGFPTVFVTAGVIGAVLALTLLLLSHTAPALAGGYRRDRGPTKAKPPSRTGRTGRPSPARGTDRKPSRAKHSPTAAPAEVKHLSRAKPPMTHPDTPKQPIPTGRLSRVKSAAPRAKPVSPPKSPSVEQPLRTNPASSPPEPIPVDENFAAPPPPDQRETTDDLLEALRPNIKPVEDPEPVSAPESELRPVKPVEADLHLSGVVRQAPPQRREVAGDQFCELRLWRGYVKCQLYVEVEGSPGALVESPLFRLRNPMVADDRAQKVLADLLADLERSGWLVVETGPVWYRRRLQRSTPTP